MDSLRNSFHLSFVLTVALMATEGVAQPDFLCQSCQDQIFGNNYTTESYLANVNHVLFNLLPNTTNISHSGFYSTSYGQNTDQVHAIGLCRGDVKPEACRSCLNDSAYQIIQRCPNRKEALGWYDNCMLRYSNRSILGRKDDYPRCSRKNLQNVSSSYLDGFNEVLMSLLVDLKNKAAAGGSVLKFATGNATAPSFKTIYALAQCTPDLSSKQCNSCLDSAIADIPKCCDGKAGGRVLTPSCNFRYQVYTFYEPTSDEPLTSPPTTSIVNNNTPIQGMDMYNITLCYYVFILLISSSVLLFFCRKEE